MKNVHSKVLNCSIFGSTQIQKTLSGQTMTSLQIRCSKCALRPSDNELTRGTYTSDTSFCFSGFIKNTLNNMKPKSIHISGLSLRKFIPGAPLKKGINRDKRLVDSLKKIKLANFWLYYVS